MAIKWVSTVVSDKLIQLTANDKSLEVCLQTFQALKGLKNPWGSPIEPEFVMADQSICAVLPHDMQLAPGVQEVSDWIQAQLDLLRLDSGKKRPATPLHRVPVRLGGPVGEDFAEVLESTGLSVVEFSRLLLGAELTVQFLGFLPGFAYLTGLPTPLNTLPRRSNPRARVPAGAFAIAAGYCAVYPLESPGGWNLIGEADWTAFDVSRDPPSLLQAGDRVQFIPAQHH